jgi:hypothetical protein
VIFGYTIDFHDEPSLNDLPASESVDKTIQVQSRSLPSFSQITDYMPHSLQEVRYGFHRPIQETKGKQVEWMMEIKGVLKLVWFPEDRTIGYERGEGYTPQRLRFWIYHTFLPLLFQMEDMYHILHVGSVEVNGKAVIFLAPSFGGKSTLTDYFLQRGHRLLSDDTLAIEKRDDGSFNAVASWPYHRPYRQPEVLGKLTENFVTEPLEIAGVYQLDKVDADETVSLSVLKGVEKFKTLHMGTFIPLFFLKERSFTFHTCFAQSVSVKRISIPWDTVRLQEVYRCIVEDVTHG